MKTEDWYNLGKFRILASIAFVLVLATGTTAMGDESFLTQSSYPIGSSEINPHAHVKDVSWIKRVSIDGVIEINEITFSIVNEDSEDHLFEICALIEGPTGKFTPSIFEPPACTSLEMVKGNEILKNQSIEFAKGVKVSDLVDISILIQEV